jgi:hypothetical protein
MLTLAQFELSRIWRPGTSPRSRPLRAAHNPSSGGLDKRYWLNGVYAQSFNRRYGRRGHLFGDRFWSGLIEDDEELHDTCLYVLANPVRAGLCATAAQWPWSGSRTEPAAWRILRR